MSRTAGLKQLLAEAELERVFAAASGPPMVLRMDDGPELFLKRCNSSARGQDRLVLHPARYAWNNGYIESFNNRLRKECLNRNH